MKSASAPPRGGAREPGSYYWCSNWIVSIDYQSKRRDVCTAAHRWRCDGWARRRSFLLGGWAPTRLQKHDQHVLTYDQPARITTPTSASPLLLRSIGALYSRITTPTSASPLLLRSIGALYCTIPIQYTIHACRKPAMSLFIHPPSKSPSSTRLLRPLIHPPLLFNSLDPPHAAYCPPLFYKGPRLGP